MVWGDSEMSFIQELNEQTEHFQHSVLTKSTPKDLYMRNLMIALCGQGCVIYFSLTLNMTRWFYVQLAMTVKE